MTKKKIENEPEKAKLSKIENKIETNRDPKNSNIEDSVKIILAFLLTVVIISSFVLSAYSFYSARLDFENNKAEIEKLRQDIKDIKSESSTFEIEDQTPNLVQNKPQTSLEIPKPDFSNDPWRGSQNARYILVEYSDYECEFCAKVHPTIKAVLQDYPDIAWVYRQMPLERVHPFAKPMAIASQCIYDNFGNDNFWGFTDYVFENQGNIRNIEFVNNYLLSAGLETSKIQNCRNSQEYKEKIDKITQESIEDVYSFGYGTPATVIYDIETDKNEVILGAITLQEFKERVDKFIKS
jgi:protein-disulfide isomerase